MLNVQFSSQSRTFLKKIDTSNWDRIIKMIEELRKNPFPPTVKRVKGRTEKTFRVRVGSYRILYIVLHKRNTILIVGIDKRPRAY